MSDKDSEELYEPNPITRLFPLFVIGYGWQVHSLLVGILIVIPYVIVNIALNFWYMARVSNRDGDPTKGLDVIKWLLFIPLMVAIGLSGASTCTYDAKVGKSVCHKMFGDDQGK